MASASNALMSRVKMFTPVLIVITFASVMVYLALLSTIQVQAVVFVSEGGGGGETAWKGILNALIFIVPAVGFAFVILYMVRKKKMSFLKLFFGTALFLTSSIIAFFFILILETLIWAKIDFFPPGLDNLYYNLPINDLSISAAVPSTSLGGAFAFSGSLGLVLTSLILSRKFPKSDKNGALLIIGGLMGSFLSFILPWWTVVPLLLGLVVWDIFAVFKGPIKGIFEASQEQAYEAEMERMGEDFTEDSFFVDKGKECEAPRPSKSIPRYEDSPYLPKKRKSLLERSGLFSDADMMEDLMSSMTYGTDEWELGIGDLVFYAMLGSHTLIVGAALIPKFGILAPWLFFLTTLIGIMVGFFITLKLLEKEFMLPGLPIPIVLGLAAMGLTYLGYVIFV